MSKKNLSPVAAAVGAAFLASGAISASADANPFAAEKLSSGYNLAASEHEKEDKKKEGKCGDEKKKEGKCGEGKCGEGKKKEGKCGEGKCGEEKKEGKKKEGTCGG